MAVAHNLAKDFPEFKEALTRLVGEDDAFSRLVDEYLELDQRICQLEELDQAGNDDQLTTLRRERVLLKDRIELALRRI
jgi:uncharacterized protein YdcH (DUF465 family)